MASLLADLKTLEGAIPLSSEVIVKLIQQHLNCPHSSRLPVLIVAAAYQAASGYLGQRPLPLASHNAADEQTGALGDVEITLLTDDNVITSFEMKMKKVTVDDINLARVIQGNEHDSSCPMVNRRSPTFSDQNYSSCAGNFAPFC